MAGTRLLGATGASTPWLLAAGDVAAILMFPLLGRGSHGLEESPALLVARVGAPFVIGWFAAALPLGAYKPGLLRTPRAFLLRSAAAWLLGVVVVGLLLRNTVFGEQFKAPFAGIVSLFTGMFLLGWRAAYARFLVR